MIFISEIGMNYNGNINLCYELIKQSKYSGADIVKFQIGWRDKDGEINRLTDDKIKKLIEWSKYFEIQIMFSIISIDGFEKLKNYEFSDYKIASRTIKHDIELAKKILNLRKNTFVSLGMSDKKNPPKELSSYKNIKYMWCKSEYPTDLDDLKDFPKDFKKTFFTGYSDHSIGIEMPLLAISRGASVIEKHFTLDKSDQTIRDHTLSATPEEFESMTKIGRDIFNKLKFGI